MNGLFIGRDRVRRSLQRAPRPVRSERARFDHRDLDPERADFLGKRFREPHDAELRGGVEAGARVADESSDRRDVDDVSRTALAHRRQHRLGHGDQAEHIGLELGAIALLVRLLDRGEVAIARVVDEHVEAARPLDGRDRGLYVGRDIDIELQRMRVVVAGDQIAELFGISRRSEHALTLRDEPFRQRPADPGRASRDEPGAGRFSHDVFSCACRDRYLTLLARRSEQNFVNVVFRRRADREGLARGKESARGCVSAPVSAPGKNRSAPLAPRRASRSRPLDDPVWSSDRRRSTTL